MFARDIIVLLLCLILLAFIMTCACASIVKKAKNRSDVVDGGGETVYGGAAPDGEQLYYIANKRLIPGNPNEQVLTYNPALDTDGLIGKDDLGATVAPTSAFWIDTTIAHPEAAKIGPGFAGFIRKNTDGFEYLNADGRNSGPMNVQLKNTCSYGAADSNISMFLYNPPGSGLPPNEYFICAYEASRMLRNYGFNRLVKKNVPFRFLKLSDSMWKGSFWNIYNYIDPPDLAKPANIKYVFKRYLIPAFPLPGAVVPPLVVAPPVLPIVPGAPAMAALPPPKYEDDDEEVKEESDNEEEEEDDDINPFVASDIQRYVKEYSKNDAALAIAKKIPNIPSIRNIIMDPRTINDPVWKIRYFMEHELYNSSRHEYPSPAAMWRDMAHRKKFFLDRVGDIKWRVIPNDYYYEVNSYIKPVSITPPSIFTDAVIKHKPSSVLDTDTRWGSGLLGSALADSNLLYHGLNPNRSLNKGLQTMSMHLGMTNYQIIPTSISSHVLQQKFDMAFVDIPNVETENIFGDANRYTSNADMLVHNVEPMLSKLRASINPRGKIVMVINASNQASRDVYAATVKAGFKKDKSVTVDNKYVVSYWTR